MLRIDPRELMREGDAGLPLPDIAAETVRPSSANSTAVQDEDNAADACVASSHVITVSLLARNANDMSWDIHIDPASGAPYYTNAATGESVWELPESAPQRVRAWCADALRELGLDDDAIGVLDDATLLEVPSRASRKTSISSKL